MRPRQPLHKILQIARIALPAAAFLSFLVAGPVPASDVESMRRQEQQRLETEIERSQVKIQRLQEGLEDQREGIEKSEMKKQGILAEIQELDERLLNMGQRLRDLEGRMRQQQRLIEEKEEELAKVRKQSDIVRRHMERRITAYYKLGKIDLINITFSAQTLPELLRFHDAFQQVIDYDKQLMKRYHQTIDDLEGARQALTLEQELLEEFIAQASAEEENIVAAREDKARLLRRVQTQAALHQQAAKELEAARADLSASLLAMRKKEKLFDQGFLLNRHNHIAPVDGTVTSLFNQERVTQFGIARRTPGITILAPNGAKVHAIYQGRVIYAGYLKGYGNTVIIDHGHDYFTITSRLERILVAKGATVKRNAIIGITGSTATIMDDGLYFEIRHRDEPQDPLEWLDRKALTFNEASAAELTQRQQQ